MLARCPRCDKPFVDAGGGHCPRCGAELACDEAASDAEHRAVVVEGGDDGPATRRPGAIPAAPRRFSEGRPGFENRARGPLARYLGTLADVCLRPSGFFTHLSREGARGVTWFAFTSAFLGAALGALWSLALLPLWRGLLTASRADLRGANAAALGEAARDDSLTRALLSALEVQEQLVAQLPQLEAQLWTALLLAPLTAFFTVHLVAGLLHFSVQGLRAPGAEPVAYEVTYRFAAYALGPLALAALPTVGSIAGLFTLVLLATAMAKLHRLGALGVVGGVVSPVLLLSWLWGQEVLPRLSVPLAGALGLAPAAAPPVDTAAALAALPPTPPPGRDHSVEIRHEGDALETVRVFGSSRGPLTVRHRVAAEPGPEGRRRVEVLVFNEGDHPLSVEIEHPPVEGVVPGSAVADGGVLRGEAVPGEAVPGEAVPAARFSALAPGRVAKLTFEVEGADPRLLLQTGPTLAVAAPEAP